MRIGIIGYGHFGKAFGYLLKRNNIPYLAYDPNSAVPETAYCSTLESLLEKSTIIIAAVPIPSLKQLLNLSAPLLTGSHIFVDVGSVKCGPCSWMDEIIPNIPHVGTHPLFGPTSLTTFDKHMRVIICPSDKYHKEASRIADLFLSLGCEILEQTPEDHDRVMAKTHAATFFISKGFQAVAGDEDIPFAPPSFHSLNQTLASSLGEASHLFNVIQTENPYASEIRQKLVDSLTSVHLSLKTDIIDVRSEIDMVDDKILELLSIRNNLSKRAGEIKKDNNLPIRDSAREINLLTIIGKKAKEYKLPRESVREIFNQILKMSRSMQDEAL